MSSAGKTAEKIRIFLCHVEDAVLVGLLVCMMGLAVAQIVMRNIWGSGFIWGDVLLRILVLWIGLGGAMIAGRDGRHIRIDLLARYFSEKTGNIVNAVVEFITGIICSIVAWHSIRFVQMEYTDGGNAFAAVPVWVCEAVIPFAFIVISLRFYMLSFIHFRARQNRP